MAAEAVDQWHEGSVVGDEPVRLIIFEILPPGVANVVPYAVPAPAQP
jgi:hypothetical protein